MNSFCRRLVLLATVACVACSGDPVERARAALAAGQLVEAEEIAARHLERNPNEKPKVRWALERIRIEALARSGRGDQALERLETLASAYPAQVDAALYLTVAAWARAAGDSAGATQILDGGRKRFPAEAGRFTSALEEIKGAGGPMDPATVERLRSLGYLE